MLVDPSKPVVEVVKRTSCTSTPLSFRWVETVNNGEPKSRYTTRGYEQELYGNENFYSATPAVEKVKALLVIAEKLGYDVGLGDCSGAFYQALLAGSDDVFAEPPEEAGVPSDCVWRCIRAMPG